MAPGAGRYRAGIDIGGTFTDLLLVGDDGRAVINKTLTTPNDPCLAVESVLGQTLPAAGVAGGRGTLVHGTTLATNTIIERKGPPTALLMTAGFRDALEIGREHRFDLYDLNLEFPKPLVPRYLRFDVPERMTADGAVLQPLDEGYIRRLVAELRDKGIRAIAVCYLHSFRNPAHERRTGEIIAETAPSIRVSLSSDAAPEVGEFQRASTAVADVYVKERVAEYLGQLQRRVASLGFEGDFFVMLSSGGIGTTETASRVPVRLLESGPAAGALAAATLGSRAGFPNLLSFDMGGTTAKLCAVVGGKPLKVHEFEVDRVYRFRRGSGLPIKLPAIDMLEIGTGGGSIAQTSALGLLKVGPESAGADPGPACYGRGGTHPTVTDADLVLGYLNPDYFLGGKMRLDVEAAYRALSGLAKRLGLTVEQAAWGIHQIVNENMANTARAHLNERGQNPRRMPLFAFGGAGPVHAYGLVRLLRLPATIYPLGAGVGSTFGLLAAPLAFDFARTAHRRLDQLDLTVANTLFHEMAEEGRALLERSGIEAADISYHRSAEMRYFGQGHEVSVPLRESLLDAAHLGRITADFERVYQMLYGRKGPSVPLEVVNWRVVVSGPPPVVEFRMTMAHTGHEAARKGTRKAYIPEEARFAEVQVFDRYALRSGETLRGPAIVEEPESTIFIGARGKARVDEYLNVIVELTDA